MQGIYGELTKGLADYFLYFGLRKHNWGNISVISEFQGVASVKRLKGVSQAEKILRAMALR